MRFCLYQILCICLVLLSCQSHLPYLESAPKYSILAQYKEESKKPTNQKPVRYLSANEVQQLKLYVKDGLLLDAQGKKLDPELHLPANQKRSGFAIYVMDLSGDLYISFDHEQGYFHHSSLLAGADVLAAGDMTIAQGQLVKISNISGHYRPKPSSIALVLQRLKDMGVKTENVEVLTIGEEK